MPINPPYHMVVILQQYGVDAASQVHAVHTPQVDQYSRDVQVDSKVHFLKERLLIRYHRNRSKYCQSHPTHWNKDSEVLIGQV